MLLNPQTGEVSSMKNCHWMVLIVLTLGLGISVNAETDFSKFNWNAKSLKKRKLGLTSKVTHNKLEKAFRHQRAERFSQAIDGFLDLLRATKNRPEEHAQMWQHLGFALAQKGETKSAIKAIRSSLELNVLPYSQTLSSLYLLSQLQLSNESPKEALNLMRVWMSLADKPTPESRVFLAQLLSQNDLKSESLSQINQAILETPNPQEKWLQFALALNQELGQHANALKLLIQLTAQFPKEPKYWRQLGGTYLSLNEDKKALAVLEMAYKQGFITEESELSNLASLYIFLDVPRKGVELIDREIARGLLNRSAKTYEMLAQGHLAAKDREQSLIALNQAAELSKSGETLTRIGMIHLENEDWDKASDAFSRSLSKGTKQPEKAYWGLAVSHLQKREMTEALKVLQKARAQNAQDRNIASLMEQVKNELVTTAQSAVSPGQSTNP